MTRWMWHNLWHASISLLANVLESGVCLCFMCEKMLFIVFSANCCHLWMLGVITQPVLQSVCDTVSVSVSVSDSGHGAHYHRVQNHTILLLHLNNVCQSMFFLDIVKSLFLIRPFEHKPLSFFFSLHFSLFSSRVIDKSGRLHLRLTLSYKSGRSLLLPLVAVAACPSPRRRFSRRRRSLPHLTITISPLIFSPDAIPQHNDGAFSFHSISFPSRPHKVSHNLCARDGLIIALACLPHERRSAWE